jgi:hypothetical protein
LRICKLTVGEIVGSGVVGARVGDVVVGASILFGASVVEGARVGDDVVGSSILVGVSEVEGARVGDAVAGICDEGAGVGGIDPDCNMRSRNHDSKSSSTGTTRSLAG